MGEFTDEIKEKGWNRGIVALKIYTALCAMSTRPMSEGSQNAVASFTLADTFIKEAERQKK